MVRSVIRSALGKALSGFPNKRVTHPEGHVEPAPPYPDHGPEALGHNGGNTTSLEFGNSTKETVRFSDDPVPIDPELSHSKKTRKKSQK